MAAPYLPHVQVPVLDQDRLQLLREYACGSAELLTELIEAYRYESAPILKALDLAVERGDREAIQQYAHALAGSAANIGGVQLERLLRTVERKAAPVRSEEVQEITAAARDLDAALAQVI